MARFARFTSMARFGVAGAAVLAGVLACAPSTSGPAAAGPFAHLAPEVACAAPADPATSEFVFPRSAYELLTEADVDACSPYQLYIARNEIFARHGYIFVSDDLRARFSAMPWYVPCYTEKTFSWDLFNQVEQSNIALIQRREAELAGTAQEPDYVLSQSSERLLDARDLQYLTAYDLYLARNEIFARHGYIFESQDLRDYFGGKAWYVPRWTADQFVWEWLSSVEMKNVALIQQREDLLATAAEPSVPIDMTAHVVSDFCTFDLPASWVGYVDVTYGQSNGYPSVEVSYRGHPDQVLVSFTVVDAESPLNGGDVGTGPISWWDDGRGRRVEMWGTNFVYLTQFEHGTGVQMYPNDLVEAALVDLSTGGAFTVETAQMSNQGEGSSSGYDFYRQVIAPTVTVL